ncbi:MAG TPA: hypothetical protein VFS05_15335, partial [Gemmatimonadaceae bacterium]|nr:hypothetical protein [Gemmatimonadaceae bacterium]
MREISLLPAETLLASRAVDFLAAGPADSVALVSHVCQLPGAPRVVAEHMAEALFSGRSEFARDGEGRWWLASQLPSAAPREDLPAPLAPAVGGLAALDYVVVDVETTGSRPWDGDRVTEIA